MKPLLAMLLVLSVSAAEAAWPRSRESFDFDWRFHLGEVKDAFTRDFSDETWRRLDAPHDFSAEAVFSPTNASGTGFLPGGIGWYRKAFVAPADWQDKLVSLEFDGVAMNSEVWINGHSLGQRPCAYSSFNYDLTPHLRPGGTNLIAVRVDHSVIADSRWYVGSGLYRHVWLISTDKIHVARHGVFVTTPQVSTERAEVAVQTRIQNQSASRQEIELTTEVVGPDGQVVQRVSSKVILPAGAEQLVAQSTTATSPRLWSPDSPMLYRAVSTVRSGGRTVDVVETAFGIRSIRFDAQQGFFLNGQPTKFKGICVHHDGGIVGAAVPDQVLERRLRIAKEIGCNAIRTSHNPMAQELYDLCDRLGLMVMDEAFDEWTGAKRKWVEGWNAGTPSLHGYAEFFEQWAEADLREMVLRDRNHPSIVLWSIGNEIDYPNDPFSHPADGVQYDPKKPSAEILAKTAPRLIQVVRGSDSTRPITAALANVPASNATGLADLLDVVGYNYLVPQYAKDFVTYPNRKFVGSETSVALDAYEIAQHPRVSGQFLWVGFDFLGEGARWPSRGSTSGVFDTCGFLKPRSFLRAALWSEQPVVLLGVTSPRGGNRGARFAAVENHWNWQSDERAELPVQAYSNCEAVELFLNGKSLGRVAAEQATNHVFRWNVPFQAGELKAVGTRAGQTVATQVVTAGQPARIELKPDRTKLAANGRDVVHVEVRLVDDRGILVPNRDLECTAQVTGDGHLLGLDNGNQSDLTALTSPTRQTSRGRALVLAQSLRRAGRLTLNVTAPGLPAARLEIPVE